MKARSMMPFCTAIFVAMCLPNLINKISVEQSRKKVIHVVADPNKPPVAPSSVVGDWYMGTMMGSDCDLSIHADHTMTVQCGGCFHGEAMHDVIWKISGNRITWSSPMFASFGIDAKLDKGFGSYLSIVRVGKNIVLVPQNAESTVKRLGYDHEYCFWRNLMGPKGLELPKEAKDFEYRPM